jgi:hypothetical protein
MSIACRRRAEEHHGLISGASSLRVAVLDVGQDEQCQDLSGSEMVQDAGEPWISRGI